jgi:hypothetical protein
MKQSTKHALFTNHFTWGLMLASITTLTLVTLTPATFAATTNFVYDAFVTPNTTPQNPPWTTVVSGSDIQTASGRLLTLSVANDGNAGPYYTVAGINTSIVNANSEYEVLSRVRVPSSSGPRSLFHAYIGDGTRLVGFGITNAGANNAIALISTSLTPLSSYTIVPLSGDDFFDIDLRKTGTSGGASDTVTLRVNGTVIDTQPYTAMSSYPLSPSAELLFGSSNGSGTAGLIELTGASFGINQAAPALIPEPSIAALSMAAFGLALVRRRR